jgi:kumamolisin
MGMFRNYLRIGQRATTGNGYDARAVGKAYGYPLGLTGRGARIGIVELGGGYRPDDLTRYFAALGLQPPSVTAVGVVGGGNRPGSSDADYEVGLDIQVAGAIAPGAEQRVYFAPNTDAGFLAAIEQAAKECHVVSISWGQAESQWDVVALKQYSAAFLAARSHGVVVYAAAGDTGANDSQSTPTTDYPASDPNVIGCGGTRLILAADGSRLSEETWNDNPATSATGGGVSVAFPGRLVPDVAGNADPQTGFRILVNGQWAVVGGTSDVAPLYAGLTALLCEAMGGPVGARVDLMNTFLTNLGCFYDVTAGDNGAYRAGPGRDQTTGLGVADGGRLRAVLTDDVADPAPIGTGTPSGGDGVTVALTAQQKADLDRWAPHPHNWHNSTVAAHAYLTATGQQ